MSTQNNQDNSERPFSILRHALLEAIKNEGKEPKGKYLCSYTVKIGNDSYNYGSLAYRLTKEQWDVLEALPDEPNDALRELMSGSGIQEYGTFTRFKDPFASPERDDILEGVDDE